MGAYLDHPNTEKHSELGAGASLASMGIYILMAAVLLWRPRGLFPAPA